MWTSITWYRRPFLPYVAFAAAFIRLIASSSGMISASLKNADWSTVPHIDENGRKDVIDFVKNIQTKVNAQEGNSLPVSALYRIMQTDQLRQDLPHTRNVVSR